ncbi:hypothetical protein Kfla_4538 [Kribbella flavida DSM 17836]|uniref:Uncharacterized protein n=1 Tax=Kribbella flavida (strain DSM 17836 / JCM 10339 / NBRC 14399) TaxID=479435 RepID=D2PXV8_KRIFD|nr:hypothetical protein [Kribbella flavida]ADB33564.1 hypothetical protein Kfla_4538 [Kribbella flavida DSM 17836]
MTLLALMLAAFAAYPAAALARRGRPVMAWPARGLAGAGPIVIAGTATYLFSVVAAGATNVVSAVLGRPLIWLVLQLAAICIVVLLACLVVGWRRHTRSIGSLEKLRYGVLVGAGVLFVPWGRHAIAPISSSRPRTSASSLAWRACAPSSLRSRLELGVGKDQVMTPMT